MSSSIEYLIQNLRETGKRLNDLTEQIAEVISSLSSTQNSPPPSTPSRGDSRPSPYSSIPPLSPLIRQIRSNGQEKRPNFQSTPVPNGANLAYDNMLRGISSISGNRNAAGETNNTSNKRYCPMQSYMESRGLQSSTSPNCECPCTSGGSSSEGEEGYSTSVSSKTPEARFKINPASPNSSGGTQNSTLLSFENQSDLVKALIDWWRSFLLTSLMHEGTEGELLSESQFTQLQTIVSSLSESRSTRN